MDTELAALDEASSRQAVEAKAADRLPEKGASHRIAELVLTDPSQPDAAKAVKASLWQAALVFAMMHTFTLLEIHIYYPYLFTRVGCCGPEQPELHHDYDISDEHIIRQIQAEAMLHHLTVLLTRLPDDSDIIKACDVPQLPPSSGQWSLSATCPNRAFVQNKAQELVAVMKPLQKTVGLFVLPVSGAIADSLGRRTVLIVFASCCVLASSLFTLDTLLCTVWGDGMVYFASTLLCVCFQPKDSVFAGIVADISGQDEAVKSQSFSTLMLVQSCCNGACVLIAYFVIRIHLQTYFDAWLTCLCLSSAMVALLWMLIQETLPADMQKSVDVEMFNPFRAQAFALNLLRDDIALLLLSGCVFLFWFSFLGFIVVKTSYLISVGFAVEETLLPEMVGVVVSVAVAAWLLPAVPKIGVWKMLVASNAVLVCAYSFWGPYTVLIGGWGPYIACALQSTGVVILLPTFQLIVSQRVEHEHQAKCQAAVASFGTVGAIFGTLLYSHLLFDATLPGIYRARPAVVSMFLATCCTGLSILVAVSAKDPWGAGYVPVEKGDFDDECIRDVE